MLFYSVLPLALAPYTVLLLLKCATVIKGHAAISFVMLGGVLAAIAGPNLAIYSQDLVKGTAFVGAFWGLALLYVIALYVLSRVTFPAKTNCS